MHIKNGREFYFMDRHSVLETTSDSNTQVAKGSAKITEEFWASLMTSKLDSIVEQWSLFAQGEVSIKEEKAGLSPPAMEHLQQALDSVQKATSNLRRLGTQVSADPNSPQTALNHVKLAKEKIDQLHVEAQKIDTMLWADRNITSDGQAKASLKHCGQKLAEVIQIDKELRAIVRLAS